MGNKNYFPKITIIIPVYNGENFVRDAINSALSQNYRNIEIIVVNDGSTDHTESILKSYGNKIKYYNKKNGGVSSALNLAIEKASGEYISWLSHDDVYYSEKISTQVKILSGLSPEDRLRTILYSNYSTIDKDSNFLGKSEFEKLYPLKKLNYPLFPIFSAVLHGCTLLVPKRCFEEIGMFDENLKATQDYDLWFKMFPRFKLLFHSEVTVKSRIHENQDSRKIESSHECDTLWIKMISQIDDSQKKLMFDSVVSFYHKVLEITFNGKYLGAVKFIQGEIEKIENKSIKNRLKKIINKILPYYRKINTVEEITAKNILISNEILSKLTDFINENIKKNNDVLAMKDLKIKELSEKLNDRKNRIKFLMDRFGKTSNLKSYNAKGEEFIFPKGNILKKYNNDINIFLNMITRYIMATDIVLDIGCGIRPQVFFDPVVHICIEPFDQYREVIKPFFPNFSNVIYLKEDALKAIKMFDKNSIDSVFLFDVIEHLNKDDGLELLQEIDRVARRQIIIFTPYGFMPQHYELDETIDAWGLNGAQLQKHLSGWTPDDFGKGWNFHICENAYLSHDKEEKDRGVMYDAMLAIKNKKFAGFPPKKGTPDFIKDLYNQRIKL